MIIKRDNAFSTVCEILTPVSDNKSKVATGVFVTSLAEGDSNYGWIVTANHVARETNDKTLIVVSTKEGRAQQLPLILFGSLSSWRHHPVADISVFQIHFTSLNVQFLQGRFLPIDHVNLEKKPVSRDIELTCIGFPNGLGTDGMFSPLTFRSFASSAFITLPRADTKQKCVFFCLENPSVGGYSGCPVLDLGYETNGAILITRERTWCHGIMHGTLSDETGGKIALVTPAFYLKDLINT